MNIEQHPEPDSGIPAALSAPAHRALSGAGVFRLEQLAELTEAAVRQLHGIGPKAVRQLRNALTAKGLSFAGEERPNL